MKRCLSDRQVIEISLERLVGKPSDLFGVDRECVRVDRRLRSWSGIDLGVTTWVVTQLPCPLGRTSLRKAQWFNLCPMTNLFFKEMVEVVKEIAPRWHTWDMHAIMRQLHETYQSKKPPCFTIREGTPNDMQSMLHAWQHNPEGIPTAI